MQGADISLTILTKSEFSQGCRKEKLIIEFNEWIPRGHTKSECSLILLSRSLVLLILKKIRMN